MRQLYFFKNGALEGPKVRNASDEICVRSRCSAGAAGREGPNLILTARPPDHRGDLRRDRRLRSGRPGHRGKPGQADRQLPQVPRQGRRARRAAGHGAPLFTSEDADPSVMARIGLQRERFSPPRASGRCPFGEGTFASTHGNGQDAPNPAIRRVRPMPLWRSMWSPVPITL